MPLCNREIGGVPMVFREECWHYSSMTMPNYLRLVKFDGVIGPTTSMKNRGRSFEALPFLPFTTRRIVVCVEEQFSHLFRER